MLIVFGWFPGFPLSFFPIFQKKEIKAYIILIIRRKHTYFFLNLFFELDWGSQLKIPKQGTPELSGHNSNCGVKGLPQLLGLPRNWSCLHGQVSKSSLFRRGGYNLVNVGAGQGGDGGPALHGPPAAQTSGPMLTQLLLRTQQQRLREKTIQISE